MTEVLEDRKYGKAQVSSSEKRTKCGAKRNENEQLDASNSSDSEGRGGFLMFGAGREGRTRVKISNK